MGGTYISFKPQWSFPENNDFTHVFIEEPGFWISPVPNAAVCDWRAMWLGGLRCFLVYDMFLEKSAPEGSWVCWRTVSDVVRHLEKFGYAQCVEPSPVVKDPPINQISSHSHIRHEQSRR